MGEPSGFEWCARCGLPFHWTRGRLRALRNGGGVGDFVCLGCIRPAAPADLREENDDGVD